LEYNSETVTGAIINLKDISTRGYSKIRELKYALKVDTKTAIKLVVDIKTLLNIIFIIL